MACRISVKKQGAPIVDYAYILTKHSDVVLIVVNMKSKRGDILYFGLDDGVPLLGVCGNEESLYLNPNFEIDEPTEISFPQFNSWYVYSANISKYYIYVCLTKGLI